MEQALQLLLRIYYLLIIESPLYKKTSAKPWSDNPEPIYGLSDYVDHNIALYRSDKDLFYKS